MTLIELNRGRSASHEISGGRTAAREFRGVNMTADQALGDASLPVVGSTHPVYAGLRLDRLHARPDGPHALVLAAYSNDGRFDNPEPPDSLGDGFGSVEALPKTIVSRIPGIAKNIFKTDGYDSEGNLVVNEGYVWQNDPIAGWDARETGSVLSFVGNAELSQGVVLGFSDLAAVRAATNAIHQINGVKYHFAVELIRQRSLTKWEVRYKWTFDPGNAYITPPPSVIVVGGATSLNGWGIVNAEETQGLPVAEPQGGFGASGSLYYRLPYHRVSVAPNPDQSPLGDGSRPPPLVAQQLEYKQDLLGWTSLPGIVA